MSRKLRYLLLPLLIIALLLTAVAAAQAESGSTPASLAKKATLKIKTQPKSLSGVAEGETVEFSLKATGTGLKYQWYMQKPGKSSFEKWKKKTSDTLSFKATKSYNGLKLYCLVKDSSGKQVQSKTVSLTLFSITDQPKSVENVLPGDKVTFDVAATGNKLKYQWYSKKAGEKKFTPMKKKTNKKLSVTVNAAQDGMELYCVVTSGKNSLTSDTVKLTLAHSTEQEGILYEVTEEYDGWVVTGCKKGTEKIILPKKLYGLPVVEIVDEAFKGNKEVNELTLSTTVDRIGISAFENCSALETIDLNQGLTEIGDFAFRGCGKASFCPLSDGIESIGYSAFDGCPGFITINGDTLTMEAAMETNLHYHIRYPGITLQVEHLDGIATITQAFESGEGAETLDVPEGIERIGNCSFQGCTHLKMISLPEGVSVIDDGAFSDDTALETAGLPNTLSYIGISCFEGCTALGLIELPASLEAIGEYAFKGCTSEELTLVLPDDIQNIGFSAFEGVKNYVHVTADSATMEAALVTDLYYHFIYPEITIQAEYQDGYATITNTFPLNGGPEEFVVPDGFEKIGIGAFEGCEKLKTITFPSSMQVLADYAFKNDDALESVLGDNDIKWIGISAFEGCTALKDFVLPDSLLEIGDHAFQGCKSLVKAVIPENTHSVGAEAYADCPATIYVYHDSPGEEWAKEYHPDYQYAN